MTPSPASLRQELLEMVVLDLLGPAGGEHETLNGRRTVRERYLTGMLAPRDSIGLDPARIDRSAVDGPADSDSEPDETPSAAPMLFPSSIGLTCVVPAAVESLQLDAWWGTYRKEDKAPDAVPPSFVERDEVAEQPASPEGGSRVWQRYPSGGSLVISLQPRRLEPQTVTPEHPEVLVEGEVRLLADCKVVTLFLVNGQASQTRNADEAWLFQAGFAVSATPDEPLAEGGVFIGRREALASATGFGAGQDSDTELALLAMRYRNTVEFAVGHGTAVEVVQAQRDGKPDPDRASRIETAVLPTAEVPKVEAPTAAEEPDLAAAVLDMRTLADTSPADLPTVVAPLAEAYERWLDKQQARIDGGADGLGTYREEGEHAIGEARRTLARLRAGIELLTRDADAATAFAFANRAMWMQRVRTEAVLARRADPSLSIADALAAKDVPGNRSWRPFQLAFVLLNLPSLTDPAHPDRVDQGMADLLFFPTGGGKTEAYLGLTAYTLAIRRLQGTVAGRDGSGGVAVLMRYTMRLLTAQQFQRAAALMCACEALRQQLEVDDARWGNTPFRIGLWVGSALSPQNFDEAQNAIKNARDGSDPRSSPVQLSWCPWCGETIDVGKHAFADAARRRVLTYCGDTFGRCEFTEARNPGEGLPVLTVDEEIYRLLPSMIVATADKFAQLPLKGALKALFGKVARRCERHGYRTSDLDRIGEFTETDLHHAKGTLPKATTVPCSPLRPPDLIIQDELHLIAGPLGTLVGLYETAIDELCAFDLGGSRVRPKVIASTATIRRAREQVHQLFLRNLEVFPPQVLDAGDSFFAREREDTVATPGRLYAGICAPGQRLKAAEARVFTTVLAAARALFDRYGVDADPWMTLVGYFGSLRELGGTRRLVEDDVRNRLRHTSKRGLADRPIIELRELTSRVSSDEIRPILDDLGRSHTVAKIEPGTPRPIDVVLATNMLSVGVDVPRLGLMVTVGQPKSTAEYIQATSRVGRSNAGPGMVFTIYNWARPRDLSHYETFGHYHATFYRAVEALSVTPFAARARDRGLTAVLVALLRQGDVGTELLNPNNGAHGMKALDPAVAVATERILRRVRLIGGPEAEEEVRAEIAQRLDDWSSRIAEVTMGGARLGYQATSSATPLLASPTVGEWPRWAVPNSLRETEPLVNLILDQTDPSLHPSEVPPFERGGSHDPDLIDTVEDIDPEEVA